VPPDVGATGDPVTVTSAALVVGTADGLHLPGRDDVLLVGRRIDALAVDGDTVWVVVDSVELHRVDGSGSAEPVAAVEHGSATCLHVHRGTVWVGGDDAALWRLHDRRLEPVESFLHAPTRDEWFTPWGGPPSVLSMASHEEDLYVGVHVGGILRTSDRGDTWFDTVDLHVDVHEVAVDPRNGTVWAATGERGLAQSTDRGDSWRFHTTGLHGTYCLAVALADAGPLVGASSGHAARDGKVYAFDGSGFTQVEGLPDPLGGAVGPGRIAAVANRAALVAPGGPVYASDDGGRRWAVVEDIVGATAIVLG
jgi:photosystem II stability/assembly factor-like uncharacterized protein